MQAEGSSETQSGPHVQWVLGMEQTAVKVQLWMQVGLTAAQVPEAVRVHLLGALLLLDQRGREQQDQQNLQSLQLQAALD